MLALENIVGIGLDHIHTCMGCQLQPRSSLRIRSARMVLDFIGTRGSRNPHQARLPLLRNLPDRHEIISVISLNKNIPSLETGMFFILK